MKNIKINFKSIVLGKARWLVTLFAILTIGVGQMWAAKQRYIYVGLSNDYNNNKSSTTCFNFWGGTSGGVKSGTWIEDITHDNRLYHMYRVQVYDDNNKAQFKGNDNWAVPGDGYNVTLNGTTNNAVFFSSTNDGWYGQFQENYQVTSTASLSANKTKVATSTIVTLTPSLATNAEYNTIKYISSATITTNPGSGGIITSAGGTCNFWATKAGTYTVSVTVTYNAKDFTGITKTATATADIEVYSPYTISANSTIVWDLCSNEKSWSEVHLHKGVEGTATNEYYTRCGSTQYAKDYSYAVNNIEYLIFRNNITNWNDYTQTTDIRRDISGVTLFEFDNTFTDKKLNWQVTTNAKKATAGRSVYFDNTDAGWSQIRLKYGTTRFNRCSDAATKVNGTDNLYVITIPNDAYYAKYYLADHYGWTNRNSIETMNDISNRIGYQESDISSDITFIPSSGSGTPKVWSATTMSGHTHNVTISAPSHGTITVAYTNESGSTQSRTSGTFAVARTCSLTVSSSAATGYKPSTLTIDGNTHTSGGVYIIKKNITVAATFTAKQSVITFDKNGGEDGDSGTTGTYDAAMTTVTVPHKLGYKFDGYWDAETDGNGSGNQYYKANGTSHQAWNKNTEDPTTLHAKWVKDDNEYTGTGSWATTANWSAGELPSTYTEVHISGEVTLSSSAHVGTVVVEEGGKLTIESTGALEVESTITNTDASKIVVKPCGALIYSGSTYATVELSLNSSRWQLIAIPVGGVDVQSTFAGKGVYTYVWDNTAKDWERRGYYDGLGSFEPVLVNGSGGYNFSGALVGNSDRGFSVTYDGIKASGDVGMYGNSWTAPIAVSGMTFTGVVGSVAYTFNGSSWDAANSGDVIPAMQGFAVVVGSSGGSVSIPYSAVRAAVNRNAALRAPKRTTSSDIYDHITIYISGNEWKNRIRLYENEQFTNDIDDGFDAVHLDGEGFAGELYAQAERKMNILAVPDLEGTIVGFILGEATDYTISFEGDGKGYYLNDILMNQSTLIAEGNTYTFMPDESTNATRFVISRTPICQTPTDVDAINYGVNVRKQMIDGVLYIIRDGRIYNAIGSVIK